MVEVAKRLDLVSDKVPSVGAVGWYARGHVSYVEEVNTDGSLVISEMNTDGHNGFVVHTVRPGESTWPDRFLHLGPVTDVVDTAAPTDPPGWSRTADEDGEVELGWTASTDDSGVTGYLVPRNGRPLAETSTASWADRQASPGQAYTYTVLARDGAGNVSAPTTTVLDQDVPAPPRWRGAFLPGSTSVIAAGDSTAVCGRLGSERDPRVGCRLRTLGGWTTVTTGRSVSWGLSDTRAFLPGEPGRIWFCRVLGGAPSANACLPLDVATRSWGFDRVDQRRAQPTDPTWVTTASSPTRCGLAGDRAACSVLLDRGWRTRTADTGTRPGDPLSRAYVGTTHGTSFCRTVEGRATCTELDVRRRAWGRTTVSAGRLPHGRWVSRPAGPTLCLPAAGCRTLGPGRADCHDHLRHPDAAPSHHLPGALDRPGEPRPPLAAGAATAPPRSLDDVEAGWLVCPVHVHVGGFSGDVAITLRIEELHRFGEALAAVRSGSRRSAVLESVEQWIDLTVVREADGSLTASGHLADDPGTGSRLRFRIVDLHELALGDWVEACRSAVSLFSLPA